MKKLTILLLILTCLSFSATAQKRKKTRVKPVTGTGVTTNEIRDGAEKVSIQLKNVSKFVYLLGGIARGIEDIDKDARAGKLSRAVSDKNQTYKQNVIASIQGLRAGLIQLESDFRVKPKLMPYLAVIRGITEISGTAEDQATNGEMVNAGKTLLQIIEKLTDTLVALP
jgi:hypothetical protein